MKVEIQETREYRQAASEGSRNPFPERGQDYADHDPSRGQSLQLLRPLENSAVVNGNAGPPARRARQYSPRFWGPLHSI